MRLGPNAQVLQIRGPEDSQTSGKLAFGCIAAIVASSIEPTGLLLGARAVTETNERESRGSAYVC